MEDAFSLAQVIRDGRTSAEAVVRDALAAITEQDGALNCFTAVLGERALAAARAVDADRCAGRALGPLAGVPFAVKNLFDVAGLTTLAGARTLAGRPPATRDATLVSRLCDAGAVLVGALNMDAYAYGFTTENSHYGPTRNPWDRERIAGGSSGGSAAAVAAGLVPVSLGSDTNGSIRVPASLCGVFGLKPTFGRLPRTGSYPFVADLDHLGPFTTSARDLAQVYDVLQGPDASDPACTRRAPERVMPVLDDGVSGLRVGRLSGYFDRWAGEQARRASELAAQALGAAGEVTLPEVERARAAAFVVTASQGGALRLPELLSRYGDMEPHSRDRLVAGAMTPAAWLVKAQKLRGWFLRQALAMFEDWDVLVAPATPVPATRIGEDWLELDGERLPLRPSLGLLTQPISCIGLPVVSVPLWGMNPASPQLPIGVQLIAAPWREDHGLRAAAALEAMGLCSAPVAPLVAGA
jgi:AtzE family amidohydrolase